MKRIISLLLVFTLIFSFTAISFADNYVDNADILEQFKIKKEIIKTLHNDVTGLLKENKSLILEITKISKELHGDKITDHKAKVEAFRNEGKVIIEEIKSLGNLIRQHTQTLKETKELGKKSEIRNKIKELNNQLKTKKANYTNKKEQIKNHIDTLRTRREEIKSKRERIRQNFQEDKQKVQEFRKTYEEKKALYKQYKKKIEAKDYEGAMEMLDKVEAKLQQLKEIAQRRNSNLNEVLSKINQ